MPGWAWLGIIAVLWGLGLARDLRPAVVRTRARLRAEGRPNRPGAAFVGAARVPRRARPGPRGRPRRGRRVRARPARRRPPRRGPAVAPARPRGGRERRHGRTARRGPPDGGRRGRGDAPRPALDRARGDGPAERARVARRAHRGPVRRAGPDPRGDATRPGRPRGRGARPPRDVERAAFRVAQLALDNVVRHAPGASVAVRVGGRPEPRPTAHRGRRGRAADRRGGGRRGAAGAGSRTCAPRRRRPARRWRSAAAPAAGAPRSTTAGTPDRALGYGSARIIPPSTGTIAPVTNDAAGDRRNAPTRPISSGVAVAAERDRRHHPRRDLLDA